MSPPLICSKITTCSSYSETSTKTISKFKGSLRAFSMGQVYCRTRGPGKTAVGAGGVNPNEALEFKGGEDVGGGGGGWL